MSKTATIIRFDIKVVKLVLDGIAYSNCLKLERSDFGASQSCPIPKQFKFQTVSQIRIILFGFQTFGCSTQPTKTFGFGTFIV